MKRMNCLFFSVFFGMGFLCSAMATMDSTVLAADSSVVSSVFNADEHLVKNSDKSYQIISPDKSITMNLYANEAGQINYNVIKSSPVTTYETVTLGDLNSDGQLTVSDVVNLRHFIKSNTNDDALKIATADFNQDDNVNNDDISALRNAIISDLPLETIQIPVAGSSNSPVKWVNDSVMGVEVNGINYFSQARITDTSVTETNRTYSHNGNKSVLKDNGVEAAFTLNSNGYSYYIDIRVYNDGVAFRYRLPASSSNAQRTINKEITTFVLRNDINNVWYGVNNQDYEAVIEKHNPNTASSDHIVAPITGEVRNNGGYISIQEAGVSSTYGGTNFIAKGNCTYKVSNTWNSAEDESYTVTGDVTTGWRLVNIAKNLDELVNNYNVYHVNEEPDSNLFSDTSWIEPGRSTWSWLTDYGACLRTSDAMYTYTNNASKLGFEYNVIDDGYAGWSDYQNELQKLGEYGENLNVKQILWAQVSTNNSGFKMTNIDEAKSYLDFLKSHHLYGGKIDFWWSEASTDRTNKNVTSLQESILRMAAERQLMINFHGCNKPAGLDATYPNELNREAIRGLENIGNAQNTYYTKQASWLTSLLFTRYLSGHGDYTPACNTAMQIASLVCIDAPFNVIATKPEEILENPAVEMIKSIPTTWDQTKVLDGSAIGESAIFAKEKNNVWFLGGIISSDKKDVNIPLNQFLGDGEYTMELWTDTADGKKVKTTKTVSANDVLNLGSFTSGTGFVGRFSKLSLSQYGGEILYGQPLEISSVSDDSIIKYTLDGSDPLTSSTAVIYSSPVQLYNTCKVRAAIVSGDGQKTEVSYKFNKVGEDSIDKKIIYNDDKSLATVSLTSNYPCDLYYTLDGTEADSSSTHYTGSFTLSENHTVNVAAISKDDGEIKRMSFFVFTNPKSAVSPDLDLGSNYLDASSGWSDVKMNQNVNGSTISLGGTNASNGTTYSKGFGLNSIGYLTYAVPDGTTQFVGVVGIDDCSYNNVSDGSHASATMTVYFDDKAYMTTPVFKQGDVYNIVVDVPIGAKNMKLYFGDADNGITCDNVSMGNPGWKIQNTIEHTITTENNITTVTLASNFNGTLYYTTDGSTPTTSSKIYTHPMKFPENRKVRVLGVVTNGGAQVTDSFNVYSASSYTLPDTYLGTDYISATTGWAEDPASVDKNTKGNTIAIAGVEYSKGISTNAIGEFKYNIPDNTMKFVGIAGVDDSVYDNQNDGYKASITCSIYFDNNSTAAYTTSTLKRGEFAKINVNVPSGAKTIRIVFGDGGDGITCDNASLGNAGWVLK